MTNARVPRIAEPAGGAEEFRFDDGWAALSEDAEADLPNEGDADKVM